MMRDAILNFPKQFEWGPQIENAVALRQAQGIKSFIVCGMGGSHLAAMILQTVKPELPITIHRDYGLPEQLVGFVGFGVHRGGAISGHELIILSSYSGNTEEVLHSLEVARYYKLPMIAISIGGELIERAKQYSLPYIQMPDTGIQPRSALGYSFIALLKAMGEEELLKECGALATNLNSEAYEDLGKLLAARTRGQIPVIYSSTRNLAIAYNWKIKLNETGKIPAFYNVFPELNHNEMTGFDVKGKTKELAEKFHFIFLHDVGVITDDPYVDDKRIQKRMEILEKLYTDRGLMVTPFAMAGFGLGKIFSSLLIADWFALHTAENYGVESEQVPMVEEFKRLIE